MTPERHAVLSASSSARWLNCPPSARLAEQFPDTGSAYAAAGTLAHAIAELKARKYFLEPMSAKEYGAQLARLKEDPSYDKDMDAATDLYLDYLKELAFRFNTPPFVALESRVDYSSWAPGGFGTADCLMIGEGKLYVCDYKNGAGVDVSAERNSQMMLYALGALRVYGPIYGGSIHTIHLAIIQPNAGGVKEWSLTRSALEAWGENAVRPAAALAWEGKGDFCSGPWCEKAFCPARARCSARIKKLLEVEQVQAEHPEAALLTDEEAGAVLLRIREEGLAAWIDSLEAHLKSRMLSGAAVPGWKLVEGRGSREWKPGADAALTELLQRGVEEALLWERLPVTPPKLEKALGKKAFTEVSKGLVLKKPGSPTLAPESDRRKAYRPAEAAFQEVTA